LRHWGITEWLSYLTLSSTNPTKVRPGARGGRRKSVLPHWFLNNPRLRTRRRIHHYTFICIRACPESIKSHPLPALSGEALMKNRQAPGSDIDSELSAASGVGRSLHTDQQYQYPIPTLKPQRLGQAPKNPHNAGTTMLLQREKFLCAIFQQCKDHPGKGNSAAMLHQFEVFCSLAKRGIRCLLPRAALRTG
jgi:hypothetical protein